LSSFSARPTQWEEDEFDYIKKEKVGRKTPHINAAFLTQGGVGKNSHQKKEGSLGKEPGGIRREEVPALVPCQTHSLYQEGDPGGGS